MRKHIFTLALAAVFAIPAVADAQLGYSLGKGAKGIKGDLTAATIACPSGSGNDTVTFAGAPIPACSPTAQGGSGTCEYTDKGKGSLQLKVKGKANPGDPSKSSQDMALQAKLVNIDPACANDMCAWLGTGLDIATANCDSLDPAGCTLEEGAIDPLLGLALGLLCGSPDGGKLQIKASLNETLQAFFALPEPPLNGGDVSIMLGQLGLIEAGEADPTYRVGVALPNP